MCIRDRITNVSHDIKTPLTSIINYVDFLKKEEIDNEQAKEYIGVRDRQATRLKKLTEDLVEASKAATGNVKLEMIPCRVGVLMMQVMGEYKEKTCLLYTSGYHAGSHSGGWQNGLCGRQDP